MRAELRAMTSRHFVMIKLRLMRVRIFGLNTFENRGFKDISTGSNTVRIKQHSLWKWALAALVSFLQGSKA